MFAANQGISQKYGAGLEKMAQTDCNQKCTLKQHNLPVACNLGLYGKEHQDKMVLLYEKIYVKDSRYKSEK